MRLQPLVYMTNDEESPALLVRRRAGSEQPGSEQPGSELPASSIRLRAADLQAAQKLSAKFSPDQRRSRALLLDIEVVIAEAAREARLDLARITSVDASASYAPDTVRYVGTVDGLTGLIQDVCAVGIADGVVLIPLSLHPTEELILNRYRYRDSDSERLSVCR